MDEVNDLSLARNRAFQEIGRLIVAYQKMEAMLKILIANQNIEGLDTELEDQITRNHRAVSMNTMGILVDKLFKHVLVTEPDDDDRSDESNEKWAFTFTVRTEQETHSQLQERFQSIVVDRNTLIHQRLTGFDTSSIESCRSITDELVAQREELRPQFDFLRDLVQMLTIGGKALGERVVSDLGIAKPDEADKSGHQDQADSKN